MNVHTAQILDHPIAAYHLAGMRQKSTDPQTFRAHTTALSAILAVEASRFVSVRDVTVETPLGNAIGAEPVESLFLVPILRAGLGMVDGFHSILPFASVVHIGIKRDEATHQPTSYYRNFPANIKEAEVILIDPMLATGGSAIAAVNELQEAGAKVIAFACCVASPEGIEALNTAHPGVPIIAAARDSHLDENAYIVPGLGDAGDRIFGTF